MLVNTSRLVLQHGGAEGLWNAVQSEELCVVSFPALCGFRCVRLALPFLTRRAKYLGLGETELDRPSLLDASSGTAALLGATTIPSQPVSCCPTEPTRTPRPVCSTGHGFLGLGGATEPPCSSTRQGPQPAGVALAPPAATHRPSDQPPEGGVASNYPHALMADTQLQHQQQQQPVECPSLNLHLNPVEGRVDAGDPPDVEGPPARLRSGASEVFRRLPSGFQWGDLSVMGLTSPPSPAPAATPDFAAKNIRSPSPLPPQLPESGAPTRAAGDWWLRRLQQQQPRQHLSPLPVPRQLGYRDSAAAAALGFAGPIVSPRTFA